MLVRYWMSETPVQATETMSLYEAFELLQGHDLRRLPVLRDQELCGLISISDMYRFIDPAAALLPTLPPEGRAALEAQRVSDHMTPSPVTCAPNDPLEEAGELMRSERIGALPVVRDGVLVGIITDTDILTAFTRMTRWGAEGKRVCFKVSVEEKIEVFYRIIDLCKKFNLELLAILTHEIREESAQMVMIRVSGAKAEEFIETLWDSSYQVLQAG